MRLLTAIAIFIAAFASTLAVNAQPHSAKLGVIDIFHVGNATKWDYPVVDSESHRLYLACNDHLQIVDTQTGKRIGDVGGLRRAHGTAIVSDKKLGFVTSGMENAIVVFDLDSFKVKQRIKSPDGIGRSPDAIVYDSASRKVFAFCAGGGAVVIDPANLDAPPVAIDLGGKLEYGRADGDGKLFVNNEDKSEIDVVDTKAMKLIDRWPLAPLAGPSGLAIDQKHHRLFAVGRNKTMAIVSCETGKLLATVPIGAGPDGCAFEPKLGSSGAALSSNGRDGTVTVVAETAPGKFAVVQTVETAKSGRTIASDPKTGLVYIPAMITREHGSAEFCVLVLGANNK
jgi:DNA-binding beta-propeller fold protein YncE